MKIEDMIETIRRSWNKWEVKMETEMKLEMEKKKKIHIQQKWEHPPDVFLMGKSRLVAGLVISHLYQKSDVSNQSKF